MKRDPNLAPLSREHLGALMLVYRLKHGRSSNPSHPWPSDLNEQVKKIQRMWQDELRWHFAAEERFLFAPLRTSLSPETQQLGERLLRDHRDLEAQIQALSELQGTPLQQALKGLGQRLEAHVRCEENEYFPALQTQLSSKQLQQAGTQILAFYAEREPFYCIFTGELRQVE